MILTLVIIFTFITCHSREIKLAKCVRNSKLKNKKDSNKLIKLIVTVQKWQ